MYSIDELMKEIYFITQSKMLAKNEKIWEVLLEVFQQIYKYDSDNKDVSISLILNIWLWK